MCHTVIPEGEPTPETISYQAESPDEAAFVVAAKRFGRAEKVDQWRSIA